MLRRLLAITALLGACTSASAVCAATAPQWVQSSAAVPPYPPASRQLREEGTVHLRFSMRPDGTVESVSVARSSGVRRLDEAALNWGRAARFTAATDCDGSPVAARFLMPIKFELDYSDAEPPAASAPG